MDYSTLQWIWLVIAALAVGISKMGLSSVVMLVIPIIASLFCGKESTGLMLPLLIMGDVMAVVYYKHHVQLKEIRRLLVWICLGLLIGLFVGQYINDRQFKIILSISVIVCIAAMIYSEVKGKPFTVPNKTIYLAMIGILGGFASMVGNAAGAIMSIYLLSREYPKDSYISTYAWLFLIINLIKLPLQIFVWHNIGWSNLYLALILLPVILVGAVAGALIVKRVNEKLYRKIIYLMTLIAAAALWI